MTSGYLALAIGALIVTIALVYLGAQDGRLRGFRALAAAYGASTLRIVLILSVPWLGSGALAAAEALHLVAAGFTAVAAARLCEWRDDRRWAFLAAAVVLSLWAALAQALHWPVVTHALPIALATGGALAFLAFALERVGRDPVYAGLRIVAAIAGLHALQKISVPLWPEAGAGRTWGLVLGGTLFFATALSLIVAAQRAQYLAARAAQRRQDILFDATPDFMALVGVDPNGRLILEAVNDSFRRHLAGAYAGRQVGAAGRPLDQTMRDDLGMSEADVGYSLAAYRRAIDSRTPVAITTLNRDRKREGVVTPIVDDDGVVRQLVYRGTDVTEAVLSREIMEAIPIGIVISARADGTIRYANPAWQRMTGRALGDVFGRSSVELGLFDSPEARAAALEPLLARGEPVQLRARITSVTGEQKDIERSLYPIEFGREPCVINLIQDVSELSAARDAAARAAQRLAQVFHVNPSPLSISTVADGRLVEVNEAWVRQWGYARDEALGRTVAELGLWQDAREREALVARMREGDAVHNRLGHFRRRDGTIATCLFSLDWIDWDGARAMVAATQDVTELEEARRVAQEESERFAKAFTLSPVPMLIAAVDDGRHLEVNEAWERYSGYAREEALGRTSFEMGIWADPAQREGILATLRAGEAVRSVPCTQRRKSGAPAEVLFSAELIDWHGAPALLAALQDVTVLEDARRTAQASSELFEKVLEINPIPMAVSTLAEGRHLFVNDAWVALMGIARERAIGRTPAELGHWSNPAAREKVVSALRAGQSVHVVPVKFARRDGAPVELLYSAAAIDWQGTPALIGIGQDVSALNRALEEIQRLNASLDEKVKARTAELEQTMRELESFSYSISHDLRAPLRHIAGYTRLLAEDPGVRAQPATIELASRAAAAATRLGTLIDELLEYSRLARKPIALATVPLKPLVASVIEELAAQQGARRVRWSVGALPAVRGDPTLVRLVVQNLLDNALKYTRRQPQARVEVSAQREAGRVTVRVRDNGIGFDMAYAGKLFGVFQRLHTDAEFEGTGIGLAHVKRIIERHGGRLGAEAAPGEGATFWFELEAA